MKAYLLLSRAWLLFCALLVVIPVAVIVAAIGEFDAEIWTFLLEYQLPVLLKNTLFLAVAVGFGVVFLGASSAWLLAMYRFPLSGVLSWAMMLPLAVPAYVLAFTQLGFFEYSGMASTYLREQWGFETGLPDIRNGVGVAAVMSLAFYPYVYLLAKNAFSTMGVRALEVGASLGLSPWQAFFKVALPMARPWIAGGLMLALMEVLADFGTVSIFGFETFTTAIYDAWFGFFSLETAKQLASLLIGFVFLLVLLESLSRKKRRFEQAGRGSDVVARPLKGVRAWLACAWCLGILTLGFILPVVQLVAWAVDYWQFVDFSALFYQAWHSLLTALLAAFFVAMAALFLVLAHHYDGSKLATAGLKIATLGYAIPGSVLAVGVFVPVAALDNVLVDFLGLETGSAIFKGTIFVMVLALVLRFLALGVSSVSAGFARVKPSYVEAAQSLGVSGFGVLKSVYVPLLKGALGVALLMTFVDVMKEMPITLMMRPHDWDMLSVRIYSFTMEGMYDRAALPALIIVLVGLLPVIGFSKIGQDQQNTKK